jgi:hypothetical protein
MEKVTFINARGEAITFSDSPPFIITSLNGTGEIPTDIHTQKAPFQDGVSYIDSSLQGRPLDIKCEISATTPEELFELRRRISKVFNSKLGEGTLLYEYYGEVKQINAIVEKPPSFPDGSGSKGLVYQITSISLFCPNPYWTDTTDTKKSLAAYKESLTLPFELPATMGIEGDSTLIINQGDVDTPFEIEFYGPSVRPKIINQSTGEMIEINRTLNSGDILYINTSPGHNKKVEIKRSDGSIENAFNWINIFNSSLFKLIPGDNILKYQADTGTEDAVVNISFKNLYVGV